MPAKMETIAGELICRGCGEGSTAVESLRDKT